MKGRTEQMQSDSPRAEWPVAESNLARIGESITEQRARSGRPHKGIDLFAPFGTAVVSARGGKVLRVIDGTQSTRRARQRAGWFVDILGEDGQVYRYLHLASQPSVRAGQRIAAGALLGTVGTSGVLHARPHLHFEVRRSDYDEAQQDYGEPIDPLTVLPIAELRNKGGLMANNELRKEAAETKSSARPEAIALDTPDAQAALTFLVSKGWTPEQVRQLLDKHVAAEEPEREEPEASGAQVEAHLLSLGWSRSDIARFLVGPDQAHQTAEALFRQHAANSSADQERLVNALARAGAQDVKPDPQLLSGLDPAHLQPEAPSDLSQLIAQFAQLPDVQKQRFLLLLASQKPKKTTSSPEDPTRPPKSTGDGTGGSPPKPSGSGSDALPVVKSSLDLLNTAIKGLLDGIGAGKRTKAGKPGIRKPSDPTEHDTEDTETDTDSSEETDSADESAADHTEDTTDFDEEGSSPPMSEDGLDLGNEREPD